MIHLHSCKSSNRINLAETHAGMAVAEEFIICNDRTNIADLFAQLSYFWDIIGERHTLRRGKLFI